MSTPPAIAAQAAAAAAMCEGNPSAVSKGILRSATKAAIPSKIHVNAMPRKIIRDLKRSSLIARVAATEHSIASGGIAGRANPGSLDCEKLKKIRGNTVQQAKKKPGDFLHEFSRQIRRPSSAVGHRSRVHGSSASTTIGPKYQNGCRC